MKFKSFEGLPNNLPAAKPEEEKVVSKKVAPQKPGQLETAGQKTDRRTFRTALQEEAHKKALAASEETRRKAGGSHCG